MKRRSMLGVALGGALGAPSLRAQEGFTLVTPSLMEAEAQHAAQHPEPPAPPRTRSIVPIIRVLAPQVGDAEISPPLRIELRFETSADARILPATFRLLYGLLKFDLTDNVRRNARISEQGLLAERAMVPRGNHRLFLQVTDDKGRMAEQELRVRVG